MHKRGFLAGAALLTLAACGSNVEPGYVAKQWAGEMRELQIQPVFPPREDFQVGDIYLPALSQNKVHAAFDEKGYLPISIWLMEAGGDGAARTALKEFYDKRSTYPQTTQAVVDEVTQTSENGGDDGRGTEAENGASNNGLSGPASQPVLNCADVTAGGSGDSCNIFTSNETTKMRRMRIVGFPTFLSTTVTQGNLSAFVPVEAFSAALGLDFGDIEKVSVNVPVAESVGLPAMKALELAEKSFASEKGKLCNGMKNGEPKGRIRALLPDGQRVDGQFPSAFHALVVSEVFYTRAIEISIETQQSFGLGAKLQTLAPTSSGGLAAQAAQAAQQGGSQNQSNSENANLGAGTGGGSGSGSGAGPGSQQQAVPGAIETLNRLRQSTSNLPSAPGGSLQIVSVSDGNVGMRRLFDRPIAIGYRGLSLLVDSRNCEVIGGASVGDSGSGGNAQLPLGSETDSSQTERAGESETESAPTETGSGRRNPGRSNPGQGGGMNLPMEDENTPAEM